jgi:RNA polymerase sigma factor (sigma-70 family)
MEERRRADIPSGMEASLAQGLKAGPLAPVWRLLGDEQLAHAARGGNDHASGALYARYHPLLRRYCASILLDPADAEDAAQAAMVKALRALAGRDLRGPLRPWLYRIAHNEAMDTLRRRRMRVTADGLDAVSVPGPEVDLARRERLAELVADLRALPDRQRSALVMRELSGLSYDEIATALDLTSAGARQAVFEARSSLHDFEQGRATECTSIQRSLSDGDGRRLRARGVRAHLRDCQDCRSFRYAISRRGEELALLPPFVLTSAATVTLAGGLLGSMAGVAGGGAPAIGTLAGLAGGPAAKSLAGAAAAVAIGGAFLGGGVPTSGHRQRPATAQVATALAAQTPVRPASAMIAGRATGPAPGDAGSDRRPGPPTRPRGVLKSRRITLRLPHPAGAPPAVERTIEHVSQTLPPAMQRVREQVQRVTDQARAAYLAWLSRAQEAARQAIAAAMQQAGQWSSSQSQQTAWWQAMAQAQASSSQGAAPAGRRSSATWSTRRSSAGTWTPSR